ncbi:N-formylglutamate amidohydrolase [Streptomyces sp. VRA16 Mangrove soil]|uniref:N-formylglutamate amidohydrolase n=1 Tax=Streptomyces sp. VRA16 Mangrove soil TaxID=2817434 RepID=UPI001A9E84E7|nr:N-formylglutamate amidohydrolase [Streptomyces sp. VRA16 Mangrove soil]MBO1334550.1 N-formylglutamate amidohydrolase [Streptomyces sp. VRA16 Mangrove soil]
MDTTDRSAQEHGPAHRLVPGAADSPVILHVPHGSRTVPPHVRAGIVLDDAALEHELDLITDAHTQEIAERAARAASLGPWRFVNERSRLVVDPERFPDEREEMRAVGMGAVYTRTTGRAPLRPEPAPDESALITRYFEPYAEAMTRAVDERLAATGRAVVIDVHSYPSRALPYELHGAGPRPPVCLGTDPFHTTDALLADARTAFAPLGETGLDSPFAGTYVPLRHYGKDPRVTALMLEVRRDVYLDEPVTPHEGLDAVAAALTDLIERVSSRP